jgi:hypothetical protein
LKRIERCLKFDLHQLKGLTLGSKSRLLVLGDIEQRLKKKMYIKTAIT